MSDLAAFGNFASVFFAVASYAGNYGKHRMSHREAAITALQVGGLVQCIYLIFYLSELVNGLRHV